jgi:transcriptional regulator with XRE-family HTH domain
MLNESLRLIRVFHDMKLTDLSKDLGVSVSHLSEVEKGKKNPSLKLIEKYAKVFDIKPSAIMSFSEDIETPKPGSKLKSSIRANMVKFLQYVETGRA